MTPESMTPADREMTDAELEAIAAGKEILSKLDPGFGSNYGRGGFGGNFANRPLPGRGGRIASNASTSGQGYA